MSTDYKFQGWMGLDKSADEGNMKWQEYEPKKWEETDVDIKVQSASRRKPFGAALILTWPSPDHSLWYVRV